MCVLAVACACWRTGCEDICTSIDMAFPAGVRCGHACCVRATGYTHCHSTWSRASKHFSHLCSRAGTCSHVPLATVISPACSGQSAGQVDPGGIGGAELVQLVYGVQWLPLVQAMPALAMLDQEMDLEAAAAVSGRRPPRMSIPGCVLLQAILSMPQTACKGATDALVALPSSVLRFVACDSAGTRVVEAFLKV